MKPSDPIIDVLAEAHDGIARRHYEGRTLLLAALPQGDGQAPRGRRLILGGTGAAAACLMVAAVWLFAAPKPLSAMERMAQAMEQISSFAWRMESVYVSWKDEGRTVRDVSIGQWRREPMGMHAAGMIWESKKTNTTSFSPQQTLTDYEETHQRGQRGILINHKKREFHWIDGGLGAHTVPGNSPQVLIYKVRAKRGRVLRELGTRTINGVEASGVELLLDDGWPASDRGPVTAGEGEEANDPRWGWRNARVEVWIDPSTDLPIEFSHVRRGDDFETRFRITELRWNLEFDAEHFVAKPVEGYTEKQWQAEAQQ